MTYTNTLTAPSITDTTPTRRKPIWPIAGIIAGIAGFTGAFASISNTVTKERATIGVDVIDDLDRAPYHLAFVLGIITVGALLVAAAGFRRWADDKGIRHLGARVVSLGFTATAGVHLIGTAAAGSLALYMPGGPDEGWMSKEGLFVSYTLLDFGMLLSFWGVLFGAIGVATLSLGRSRALPKWMGIVSILLVLPPIAFGVGMALPGFPGLTMPIWLVITSLGLIFSRTARA